MERSKPRELFSAFLREYLPEQADALLPRFELYLEELYRLNGQVNLVSRRTPEQDYWLHHFLDSLLILKCMTLGEEAVLDFGSGGGLPGIPLQLVFPDLQVTLLDSVGKKVKCLQEIIAALGLPHCTAVWSRLEDFASSYQGKRFDLVLCRSVKLVAAYVPALVRLLKQDGRAVFYKAHRNEDVSFFPDITVQDVSTPELGKRQIITVPRSSMLRQSGSKKQKSS